MSNAEAPPGGDDFGRQAAQAVRVACARGGLPGHDARLMRRFGNAVYHLPAAGAVARIARSTSPSRLVASLQVTRWLAETGFPTVEPLPVEQPIGVGDCLVTFWHFLPQQGPPPGPAELGALLTRLHGLPAPPVALPPYDPLPSVTRAIARSRAITEEERAWLQEHSSRLADAYRDLDFALPAGLIHGDAYYGNLLRDGSRVVLADWDTVGEGPREIDLVPTMQARRFGLPEDQRAAFISAYGHDVTRWPGFPTLHAIRELNTLSALLRDAHTDPDSAAELALRISSIRRGDHRRWRPF